MQVLGGGHSASEVHSKISLDAQAAAQWVAEKSLA
jgi:hypothetical protein